MPTDEPATTTGVVVAGGRSTRFGDREKALAKLDGRPMLVHVVSALAAVSVPKGRDPCRASGPTAVSDGVVVNCRSDQRAAFADALADIDTEVRWALDEREDEGPLAGLATALSTVDTDRTVVLGCDMPLADADALAALRDRLGAADAAVPRTDGGPEPLHAVYRVEPTLAAARAALDDGERSLRALLGRLTVAYHDDIPTRSLTSVDTEERLRAVETDESLPG